MNIKESQNRDRRKQANNMMKPAVLYALCMWILVLLSNNSGTVSELAAVAGMK